ncbi:MAG TPA: hypothetical protein VE287_05980 [Actinopolymorphaceae bacterium]|nr:hypothetical protein [Actinopolymorphaceae bacterium]
MTSQERRQRSRERRGHQPDGVDESLAAVRKAGCDKSGEALSTMVAQLDVEPGMRILEVTDGSARVDNSRWEHAGVAAVDTIPLRGPDHAPYGRGSYERTPHASARYDRVIVTVPVSVVSAAWVDATRAGGVVVVPWANPLAGPALVRLVVDDERAAGPFVSLLNGLPPPAPAPAGLDFFALHGSTLGAGAEFTCALDPAEIWSDPNALFALGLRIPDVHYTEAEIPDGRGRFGRWVYDQESWAGVTVSATGSDRRWEHYGFSRLGGALDTAYRWWLDNDRPGPDRFGMTVASFGQFGWLGDRYSGRIWRL